MSYTHDRDKMPTIHPDLGKFDFVVAKDKREWAQCKGIGSKEWIEFANLMFEQFPFIYNTCLLMNDQQKSQQSTIDRLTEQLNAAAEENAKLVSEKYPFAHIRIDCSEYERDQAIRNKLIELGWTPPAEIEADNG